VANRGEIARRVFATCRRLGIGTVAVYTDPDAHAPHAAEADARVRINSYLDAAELVEAARSAGADAVHPGYGVLSENSHFAEVCRSCDIGFIGPAPEAMERVGDKNSARALAREAGLGYATLSLVVNWAAGVGGGETVSLEEIMGHLREGMGRVLAVVGATLALGLSPQAPG
jgi:acetyl/propionyl-CoA carboxylase alpha subunit